MCRRKHKIRTFVGKKIKRNVVSLYKCCTIYFFSYLLALSKKVKKNNIVTGGSGRRECTCVPSGAINNNLYLFAHLRLTKSLLSIE